MTSTIKNGDIVFLYSLESQLQLGAKEILGVSTHMDNFCKELEDSSKSNTLDRIIGLNDFEFIQISNYVNESISYKDAFYPETFIEPDENNKEGMIQFTRKFLNRCLFIIELAYPNVNGLVRYETEIRLKNRYTGMYLAYNWKEETASSVPVYFQKEADDLTIINLQSVSNARLESDVLESTNIISLSFSGGASQKFLKINGKITNKPEPIVLQRFGSTPAEDQNLLLGGDIVRLLHIDTEGFLQSSLKKDYFEHLKKTIASKSIEPLKEVFTSSFIGKNSEFGIFSGAFNNFEFQTYGCENLFVVVRENIYDGSPIKRGEKVKLLNTNSDLYLDLEQLSTVKRKLPGLPGQLLLCPTHEEQQEIRYDSMLKIKTSDEQEHLEMKKIYETLKIDKTERHDAMLPLKLGDQTKSNNICEEFTLVKVPKNVIRENLVLKDMRKMLLQLGAANFKFLNEKKRDRTTILDLIKLIKVASLSLQLMINFLSANDAEEGTNKTSKIRNKLIVSKYKHFSDLYIDQILYLLSFQMWNIYLQPYFSKADFQEPDQKLLALAALKFVEFGTFIINLTYQNSHSIRLIEDMELFDLLANLTITSSKSCKPNLEVIFKHHFATIHTRLNQAIISELIEIYEKGSPNMPLLEFRARILDMLSLIAENHPINHSYSVIKLLIGEIQKPLRGSLDAEYDKLPPHLFSLHLSKFIVYQSLSDERQVLLKYDDVENEKYNPKASVYKNKVRPPFVPMDRNKFKHYKIYQTPQEIQALGSAKPDFDLTLPMNEFLSNPNRQRLFKAQLNLFLQLANSGIRKVQLALEQLIPFEIIQKVFEYGSRDPTFKREIVGYYMGICQGLYLKNFRLQELPDRFCVDMRLTIQSVTNEKQIYEKAKQYNAPFTLKVAKKNQPAIDQPNEDQISFEGDAAANLDVMGILCQYDQALSHSSLRSLPAMITQKEVIVALKSLALQVVNQDIVRRYVGNGYFNYCRFFTFALDFFRVLLLRKCFLCEELLEIYNEVLNSANLFSVLQILNERLVHEEKLQSMSKAEWESLCGVIRNLLNYLWLEKDYRQFLFTTKLWEKSTPEIQRYLMQNQFTDQEAMSILRQSYRGVEMKQASELAADSKAGARAALGGKTAEKRRLEKVLTEEKNLFIQKAGFDTQFLANLRNQIKVGEFQAQNIAEMYGEMWGNNQEVYDFLPPEEHEGARLSEIIGVVIDELYKKECQFIESLEPSQFQIQVLQLMGQDEEFTVPCMRLLLKEYFPLKNIRENLINSYYTSSKNETYQKNYLRALKTRLGQLMLGYEFMIETPTEEELLEIIYLFVSRPEQQFYPGLLESFYVRVFQGVKCRWTGRWFTKQEVLRRIQEEGASQEFTPVKLAEECESQVTPEQRAKVEKDRMILNHEFQHIVHQPEFLEESFVTTRGQELMCQLGLEKVMIKFLNLMLERKFFERDLYKNSPKRRLIIKYCLRFLYFFILDNEPNALSLAKSSEFRRVFLDFSFDFDPELQCLVLEVMRELFSFPQCVEMFRQQNLVRYYSVGLARSFEKDDYTKDYSLYKYKKLDAVLALLEVINPLNISDEFRAFAEEKFTGLVRLYFRNPLGMRGMAEGFQGDDLLRQSFQKLKYPEQVDRNLLTNRGQRLNTNSLKPQTIEDFNFNLLQLEVLSLLVRVFPENLQWTQNKLHVKVQNVIIQEQFQLVFDPAPYSLLAQKSLLRYFTNIYLHGAVFNDKHPLYLYLKTDQNMKGFLQLISSLDQAATGYVPQYLDGLYHFYVHRNTPSEYLFTEGVLPFLQHLIQYKVFFRVFQKYFRFQHQSFQKLSAVFYKMFLKSLETHQKEEELRKQHTQKVLGTNKISPGEVELQVKVVPGNTSVFQMGGAGVSSPQSRDQLISGDNLRKKDRSLGFRQLLPEFTTQFVKLVRSVCELGFDLKFIGKKKNLHAWLGLVGAVESQKYIDNRGRKFPYLIKQERDSVRLVQGLLRQLEIRGSNLDYYEESLQNVNKYLTREIVPMINREINSRLEVFHQKNFLKTFPDRVRYRLFTLQMNDESITEEFLFFSSSFEDMYLFLTFRGGEDDENAIRPEFFDLMCKKYGKSTLGGGAPQTLQGVFSSEYEQVFRRPENMKRVFQHILAFIEEDNLTVEGCDELNISYLKLLQGIFFLYGGKAFNSPSRSFNHENRELKRRELALLDEQEGVLREMQNYFFDQLEGTYVLTSFFKQAYFVINSKIWKKYGLRFLEQLTETIKLGAALLTGINRNGQEQFYRSVKDPAKNNQTVLFGLSKILRKCSTKIQEAGSEQREVYLKLLLVLLKYLQDLSDGQYQNNQDYLREQPGYLKSANVYYELINVVVSLMNSVKQSFFNYHEQKKVKISELKKVMQEEDLYLLGGRARMGKSPQRRQFLDWSQQPFQERDYFVCLNQSIMTINEFINGSNLKNILILINNLQSGRINEFLQYYSSYFQKLNLRIPSIEDPSATMEVKYFGAFAAYDPVGAAVQEKNASGQIYDILVQDPARAQNSARFSKNTTLSNMGDSNQSLESSHSQRNLQKKIRSTFSSAELTYNEVVYPLKCRVRELVDRDESTWSVLDHKQIFTQTVLESERGFLTMINMLYQFKQSIETSFQEGFDNYLRNLDYVLMLDNVEMRFDECRRSCYAFKVMTAYTFVLLANLNKPLSRPINFVMKEYQRWEEEKKDTREHNQFVGQVEIIDKNKKINRIYFKMPRQVQRVWSFFIISNTREILLDKISRDNAEDKIRDMHQQFVNLEEMVIYQNILFTFFVGNFGFVGELFIHFKNSLFYQARLLIFVIIFQNIMMLVYASDAENKFYYEDGTEEEDVDRAKSFFHSLSVIGIVLSCFVTFIEFLDYNIFLYRLRLRRARDEGEYENQILPAALYNFLLFFQTIFESDGSIMMYIFVLVLQILANSYSSLFFSYSLILILWEIDLTKEVISAVTQHFDQVIATIILAIILIFCFAVTGFYATSISVTEFNGHALARESLWDYYRSHIQGFDQPPTEESNPLNAESMIWHFLWVLFINQILQSIISGIIIDTFGERRQNRESIQEDTQKRCFICNIDRDEFERAGEDFNYHQNEEHNLNNYLYYFMWIKKLSESDRTSIDEWILYNIENQSIEHIPIKRCLMIRPELRENE